MGHTNEPDVSNLLLNYEEDGSGFSEVETLNSNAQLPNSTAHNKPTIALLAESASVGFMVGDGSYSCPMDDAHTGLRTRQRKDCATVKNFIADPTQSSHTSQWTAPASTSWPPTSLSTPVP